MRVVLRGLRAVNDAVQKVVLIGAALLVAVCVVVVFSGALFRYLTGTGLSMMLELPPMLIPWLVFPLAGVLLRSDTHITVDFMPALLGPNSARLLRLVVSLVAFAAGLVFCVAGMEAVTLFRLTGQVTEMEWEFPIWWVYVSFPVGFLILVSAALENILSALIGDGEPKTELPEESEAQSYLA